LMKDIKYINIEVEHYNDTDEESFTNISSTTSIISPPSPPVPPAPSKIPITKPSYYYFFSFVDEFLFAHAYTVAFIGSLFYGIASIVSFDPSTIVANKNITIFINIYIGLCGLISVFNWYQNTQVPVIGNIFLPNGTAIIKTQN